LVLIHAETGFAPLIIRPRACCQPAARVVAHFQIAVLLQIQVELSSMVDRWILLKKVCSTNNSLGVAINAPEFGDRQGF
jgi:hypothetical protein